MKEVNGKVYPLWSQFENPKWVGGKIYSHDMGTSVERTIKEIVLEPNGKESAMLCFYTEEGDRWAGDVSVIGIDGTKGPNGGLMISCQYAGYFELVGSV